MPRPNKHLLDVIVSSVHNTNSENTCENYMPINFRTDLDFYANIPVIGKHIAIVADTGKTIKIKPFSNDCGILNNIKIVNTAIKWNCEYNDIDYILMIKNALYISSIKNNHASSIGQR